MTQKRFVVWKYILENANFHPIDMPAGARILSVGMRRNQVVLWAAHDEGEPAPSQQRKFRIVGTGHPTAADAVLYIGTVQDQSGLVWHIFEVGPEAVAPPAPVEAEPPHHGKPLVEALRAPPAFGHEALCAEAADEIEALRKTIDLALADTDAIVEALVAKAQHDINPCVETAHAWRKARDSAWPAWCRASDRRIVSRHLDGGAA